MFKIECFCEDKNLAPILHALAGVGALNVSSVPVMGTNPALAKPAVRLPHSRPKVEIPEGGAHLLLVERMKKLGKTEVTAAETREILKDLGLSPTSYSYMLTNAVNDGLIKKGPRVAQGMGHLWRLTAKGEDKK